MAAKIEKVLVDAGHVETAVKIQNRAKVLESGFRRAYKRKQLRWIQKALDLQWSAARLVQGEHCWTCLTKDLGDREKNGESLTDTEKKNLTLFQNSLRGIDRDWWFQNMQYHEHQLVKPKGAFVRAFDLYAQGHLSYTQEEVQAACRAMGGCCAYDCGCCYKERKTHRMNGVFMHCARWCVCCVQRRQPRNEENPIWCDEGPKVTLCFENLRLASR